VIKGETVLSRDKQGSDECTLCRVVDSGRAKDRPFYDTHLFSTKSFVVIPAVGPVNVGHVMVVSREHVPNFACLSRHQREEYEDLLRSICEDPSHGLSDVLEAEHGGAEGERGGACITHVHVNLIPNSGSFYDMLQGRLRQQSVDHSLTTLEPSAAPYVLLRNSHDVRLHSAKNAPSQLIRRILFEKLGRDDWDWAAFPQLDVVTSTIRLWRHSVDT